MPREAQMGQKKMSNLSPTPNWESSPSSTFFVFAIQSFIDTKGSLDGTKESHVLAWLRFQS
jgi:hypothetical protein